MSLYTFRDFVEGFSDFVLIYFLLLNGVYLLLILLSFVYLKLFRQERMVYESKGLLKSDVYKSISIIIPAYNEEEVIVNSINSLLQLDFNDYEIIVVNDGSTDQTLPLIKDEFRLEEAALYSNPRIESKEIKQVYTSSLHENLIVLDKENGKRADAVNAGINMCHKDLICTIDADSWLEQNVLRKMLRVFIEDETTIGAGGIIRVSNGSDFEENVLENIKLPSTFTEKVQIIEYLRAFLYGRVGWDKLNSLLIISGAFAVFDREAVLKVGGYDKDSVGEDFELTLKLHRYYQEHDLDYKIRFIPEPVCWTKVPDTWSKLSSQRDRWQRGLIGTLMKHKKMILNPKYGAPGLLGIPFYLFFEFLGPVIEFTGYILVIAMLITGTLNTSFALLFLTVAVIFGMILSLSSVIMDEMTYRKYPKVRDTLKLIWVALAENLGYRQLHTWWRIKGTISYLQGKTDWDSPNLLKFSDSQVNISHWIWIAIVNLAILSMLLIGL